MTRKRTVNRYWDEPRIADAITRYNASSDPAVSNAIYETELDRPFRKLVENIFNTFKFPYTQENMQADCLCHLVRQLHSFDRSKKRKRSAGNTTAFGYFGTIAKYYFILHNQRGWKAKNQTSSLDVLLPKFNETIVPTVLQCSPDLGTKENLFLEDLNEWWATKHCRQQRKNFKKVGDCIVELFNTIATADIPTELTKKNVFKYLRTHTGLPTPRISHVITCMKRELSKWKESKTPDLSTAQKLSQRSQELQHAREEQAQRSSRKRSSRKRKRRSP